MSAYTMDCAPITARVVPINTAGAPDGMGSRIERNMPRTGSHPGNGGAGYQPGQDDSGDGRGAKHQRFAAQPARPPSHPDTPGLSRLSEVKRARAEAAEEEQDRAQSGEECRGWIREKRCGHGPPSPAWVNTSMIPQRGMQRGDPQAAVIRGPQRNSRDPRPILGGGR